MMPGGAAAAAVAAAGNVLVMGGAALSRTELLLAERNAAKARSRQLSRDLKNDAKRRQRLAQRLRGHDDSDVMEILGLRQIAQAKAAEDRIARGEARPLEGVPLGVKDLEDAEGLVNSYGSPPFKDNVSKIDSTQVSRFKAAGAIVVGLLFAVIERDLILALPRRQPRLWLLVMCFYPLVSVYPQEIIFRAFVFHRYERLFGDGLRLVVVSAVAFGAAHLFFGNWVAPVLTTLGGYLFARTYARSGSVVLASIEHALWGDLVFTLGIGVYFYGRRPATFAFTAADEVHGYIGLEWEPISANDLAALLAREMR